MQQMTNSPERISSSPADPLYQGSFFGKLAFCSIICYTVSADIRGRRVLSVWNTRLDIIGRYGSMQKIAVVLLSAALVIGIIYFLSGPDVYYSKEMIIENIDAYTEYAQLCLQCYDGTAPKRSFYADLRRDQLCCSETDAEYPMTREQAEAANTVSSTLWIGDQTFERTYVSSGFVCLTTVELRASVIYSADDTEPQFLLWPGDGEDRIYISKITDYWYFVNNGESSIR